MLDSGLSKEQMLRAQHRIAQQIVFEVAARKVVLVGAVTVYRQAEARCIRDAAAAEQHAAADAAAFAAADACWECRHAGNVGTISKRAAAVSTTKPIIVSWLQ